MKPAIVFIGFMGAGKSTALAAARAAGLETTEIDELMERELGKTIRRAFEEDGEEAFRAREAEAVGRLLDEADGGAIALGGGSVLSEQIRTALGRHIVVWLEVDAAGAWRRIEGTERPLATSEEDVARLLAERLPLYEALADAIVPMSDAGVVARALPAIQALAEMPEGTRLLWASSASGDYPILVGTGSLKAVHDSGWWPAAGRRFCIVDPSLRPQHANRLEPLSAKFEVRTDGEQAKTIEEVEWVTERLASCGMTRSDHIVALGGGVVGDLAGFCAHIYQRGVPIVQVPTTLVAQVDSAYGGKTGVDLPGFKNYVGAYHQPAGVITDPEILRTLPAADLAAGFVEAIKTGLLAGGKLWEEVQAIDRLEHQELSEVVFGCARYKTAVVAADERDAGLRHVLNLGHTVGHAIEEVTGFALGGGGFRHGEAVGLGLLAALRLSGADALRADVKRLLDDFGLPVRLRIEATAEDIVQSLQHDKKRTSKGVGFVLLSAPGEPRAGELVPDHEVLAAVGELYT